MDDDLISRESLENKPEKSAASRRAKNNKAKGHDGERDVMHLYHQYGYEYVATARLTSRLLDNCGIDLNYTPIATQIKTGALASMNIGDVLKYIDDRRKECLPPDSEWHNKLKAVFHNRPVGKGKKTTPYHRLVYMTQEDYMALLNLAFPKQLKPIQEQNDTQDTQ